MTPSRPRRVAALARLEPGEVERVGLMLALSLLSVGGVVITGQLAGRSLFLSALPSSAIPLRFVLPPLAMVGAVALYARAATRFSHARLVRLTLIGAVVGVVGARLLVATPAGGTIGALLGLFIFLDVAGAIVMIVFWTLAGDLFHPREAKRLFGLIAGGSTIANIVFGAVLSRFATAMRPQNLLLLVLASLLGALWIVTRIARRYPSEHDSGPAQGRSAGARGGLRSDLRELAASPLLRTIAAIVVVVALVGNIADYQLDLALKASYGSDGQGIVRFLALFRLVAGIVGAVLQLAVAGWLLTRFGVLPVLLLLPAAVGLGGLSILLSAGALWAVAIPRAADASLKYTLHDSAFHLLYLPLSARLRARAKVVVDGLVKAPLVALLGLAFLLAGRAGGTSPLTWTPLLLIFVALWIVLLFRASRQYVEALSHSLTMRRLDLGTATVDFSDETSARVLARTLAEPDPLRVLHALALVRAASESDWSDLVAPLLGHADPVVRAEAARYLGDRGSARHAERLRAAMGDPDDAVRGAAIAAYCATLRDAAVPEVVPLLADPSLGARGAAILGLIRSCGLGGFLHAGRPLHQLLHGSNPAERRRGGELLGELAVPGFYGPLVDLMDDTDDDVRRTAIRAGARVGAPELVPKLREQLRDPALRGPVVDALLACTARDPAGAAGLILDRALPSDARAALCRALAKGKSAPLPVLARIFEEADDPVRPALYRTLLELRAGGRALPVDPARLASRLREESRACLDRWGALADLRRDGGAHPLLEDALEVAAKRGADRLLSLLALRYEGLPVARVRTALASADARARANALELVDNVAPEAKDFVIPCFAPSETARLEAVRRAGIANEPGASRLARLRDDADPWIRTCARGGGGAPGEEVDPMAVASLEKVLFLKQVPLFREIPAEEIAALLPIAEEVSFAEGEVILRQGEAGDALFLIVEGRVAVSIDGVPRAETLGPRDVVGELAILTGDPRAATCTAATEVLALRIGREPFWELLRTRPEVSIGVIKIVLGYLKKR